MRLHVHTRVPALEEALRFYTALFGPPALVKEDYAKWEPDGFPIIFAISTGGSVGVQHLGLKGTSTEIDPLVATLAVAGFGGVRQEGAECCYAVADKIWVLGPGGEPWELYSGTGSIEMFGDDLQPELTPQACCTQGVAADAACCKEVPAGVAALAAQFAGVGAQ